MKALQSEVVTIITTVGEIVGRLKSYDDNTITLINPRLFVQSEQGVGFLPTIGMTSEREPEELQFQRSAIVTVIKTFDEVQKAWQQTVSGIVLA